MLLVLIRRLDKLARIRFAKAANRFMVRLVEQKRRGGLLERLDLIN